MAIACCIPNLNGGGIDMAIFIDYWSLLLIELLKIVGTDLTNWMIRNLDVTDQGRVDDLSNVSIVQS